MSINFAAKARELANIPPDAYQYGYDERCARIEAALRPRSGGREAMTRPRLTRKKKSVSAAQRTIAFLKKYGYAVGIAEKWNPHVGIRQDLFGFIDLVAIKAGCPIRAINCTTASEIGRHLEKYNANPHIRTWLSSSGKPSFELWAWRRLKAPKNAGRKRVLWSPRIFVFELCDDGNVTPVERFYSNPRNRVGGGFPT